MQSQTQQDDFDRGYYDRIVAQFEATHGALTEAAKGMIERAARLELLAAKASGDLDAKGLKETVRNGRQAFLRENKSLGQYLKIIGQQTSLLQALKLLPGRRSGSSSGDDDDEDEEGGDGKSELDDY